MALSLLVLDALTTLQRTVGEANAEKGFREEGDDLRGGVYASDRFLSKNQVDPADDGHPEWEVRSRATARLRNYYANKLLLIVSEVTEAHDELRSGRGMAETYYPTKLSVAADVKLPVEADHYQNGHPHKPEGVPSELADVVIRAFDLADEAGIDLAAMIDEKLTYNATRPFKHGKKF